MGGHLRNWTAVTPRPWPVGPWEIYGNLDFSDGDGKAVFTLYVQRGSGEEYVLRVDNLGAACGWLVSSLGHNEGADPTGRQAGLGEPTTIGSN